MIIGDALEDYLDLYAVNRHWLIEENTLFANINFTRHAEAVDLEYLEELFDKMCSKSIKVSFLKKKDEFIAMPLGEWLDNLKEGREEGGIPNVDSVEEFLKKFADDNNEKGISSVDMRKKYTSINGILKEIRNPPNDLQWAVA